MTKGGRRNKTSPPMDPDRFQMRDLKRRITSLEKKLDREIERRKLLQAMVDNLTEWASGQIHPLK